MKKLPVKIEVAWDHLVDRGCFVSRNFDIKTMELLKNVLKDLKQSVRWNFVL